MGQSHERGSCGLLAALRAPMRSTDRPTVRDPGKAPKLRFGAVGRSFPLAPSLTPSGQGGQVPGFGAPPCISIHLVGRGRGGQPLGGCPRWARNVGEGWATEVPEGPSTGPLWAVRLSTPGARPGVHRVRPEGGHGGRLCEPGRPPADTSRTEPKAGRLGAAGGWAPGLVSVQTSDTRRSRPGAPPACGLAGWPSRLALIHRSNCSTPGLAAWPCSRFVDLADTASVTGEPFRVPS